MGKDLSKFRGCLIGGAAGDALGYAVEFMSAEEIFIKYGERGITSYELRDGLALISDDTQMTLFTANGLLHASTMQQTGGPFESYPASIAVAYRDWLRTQGTRSSTGSICWLNNVRAINETRAPGNTCLSALRSGICGRIDAPINDSKGCGGVMRVAPIGLYLQSLGYSLYESDMIAAEAAAVTHGHPLGYIPAAALAQIIGYAVNMPGSPLLYSVMSAKHALARLFPGSEEAGVMTGLIDKAMELSMLDLDDLDAIRQLGKGWTGEECLAIAIYCALKYSDNFDEALIAAVNHDGDSDSTGAVTGSILGAFLGIEKIPEKYTKVLELRDVILEMADDLCNDCPISFDDVMEDRVWVSKYIDHDYVPGRKEPEYEPVLHKESEDILKGTQMQMDIEQLIANLSAEQSVPEPEPIEVPEPEPVKEPEPTIDPEPIPEPIKEPEPDPEPIPEPIKEPEAKPAPIKKPVRKPRPKSEPEVKVTPLTLQKPKPKAKPEPVSKPAAKPVPAKKPARPEPEEIVQEPPVERPADPGTMKFFEWTDASFGGYDVLMVCDKNAYLTLCCEFRGCRLDALCEGGKYYFLVDSGWEEFTPLRKPEYLHPEGSESPKGDPLKKFKFNPASYSFRVYTDKEIRK